MEGALAVIYRSAKADSFVARISMPGGRLANVISFFKFVNLVRCKNFRVSAEEEATVRQVTQDLRLDWVFVVGV